MFSVYDSHENCDVSILEVHEKSTQKERQRRIEDGKEKKGRTGERGRRREKDKDSYK